MPSTRVAGPSGATTAEIAPAAPTTGSGWALGETLARMSAAHREAGERLGIEERSFAICGLDVTIRFAGEAAVQAVEPAIAHLAAAKSDAPALEVEVWDSATSRVPVPERVARTGSSAAGDAGATRIRTSFQHDPEILTLYDSDRRVAVVWVPDARGVPSNEVASPLRVLLHWWARDHGLQFVHAGAVGLNGRAVLLAGPSGAGKSTTALAGLASGLDYLGDDYVVVDARAGAIVHSLYSAAKLQPDQVAAFPQLRPMLSNPNSLASEKALWFAHRHFPQQTVASATAIAVLVPRVSGEERSAVAPISRSTALAALAPSTIAQLSGADQWSMSAIAAFLERVPAYRLDAGRDLAHVAEVIRQMVVSSA